MTAVASLCLLTLTHQHVGAFLNPAGRMPLPLHSSRLSAASLNPDPYADFPRPGEQRDYPRPRLEDTSGPFVEASEASEALKTMPRPATKQRVIVIGGGLAGLSTAKHLVDAGHEPVVVEARDVLGVGRQ